MIKKWIPNNFKITLKIAFQFIKDLTNGTYSKLIHKTKYDNELPIQLSISQPIKKSEGFEAKLNNLKIASLSINKILLKPNDIFSFWHLIGNPTNKNGYKKGRSLENGEIKFTNGGGLCQLSGLIYHVTLQANLKTIERFNHSIDLYNEQTRFTPLGSDATVVYANKDFRFTNNLKENIYFSFSIENNIITCNLHANNKIRDNKVLFSTKQNNKDSIKVQTYINDNLITESFYKKRNSL